MIPGGTLALKALWEKERENTWYGICLYPADVQKKFWLQWPDRDSELNVEWYFDRWLKRNLYAFSKRE